MLIIIVTLINTGDSTVKGLFYHGVPQVEVVRKVASDEGSENHIQRENLYICSHEL